MKEKPPRPAPGPNPPDDNAPLNLEHTPAHGIATNGYVLRKLEQAEAHMRLVAEETARSTAREEHNGKPVIPKSLTPWFFAGFTMCGAVMAVAVSYPEDLPRKVLVWATVGSFFFGGMLGLGSGLRK